MLGDRDTLLSITAWEDQLCRLSRRLYDVQPADAADLLADAESGVADEERFLESVVGRVSLDTIDFAVESVRCLGSVEEDDSSGRSCMYPGVGPISGGE